MMKCLLIIFCFCITAIVSAQNFKGQWKGEFVDKSTSFENWGGDRCDYVLELESIGNKVSGFSYTYFSEGGKKFYTICKLEGFINKSKKYIEVKETERTKTNVPVNIRNCFQTHKLTYVKQGDTETLEGSWVPAPRQSGDCGFGVTSLTRRVLQLSNNSYSKVTRSSPPVKKYNPVAPNVKDKKPSLAKPVIKPKNTESLKKDPVAGDVVKKETVINSIEALRIPLPVKSKVPSLQLEKRNYNVLKTIEVMSESVTVALYDNGEVDGDSVSLYYNGKLIASKKRLSERSLTFNLTIDKDTEINELVMYAENLGSIPPNTALMVVTDGLKRYEVRITSDLQKNGVIRFVHNPKTVTSN
ncbi:MAG: hypothetical protein WKF35_03470 [Ferruginibacter sp.]